jgi:hypothetical protein
MENLGISSQRRTTWMSRSLALLASVALVDGTSFARLQHAGFSIALASVLAQPVSSFQVNGPLRMASVRRSLAVRCQEGVPAKEEDPAPAVSDGMCALCGSKLFPNCNGQGRVVGGLTAIDVGGIKPFEWWPIKVLEDLPRCVLV